MSTVNYSLKHKGVRLIPAEPRLCVAIKQDSKSRILVAPIMKTTSNQIILDNNIERQISKTADGRNKWIEHSDVYDERYITPQS